MNDEIVFHFFLRTFSFQAWSHNLVKEKNKRFPSKHEQFEGFDFEKNIFVHQYIMCLLRANNLGGGCPHSGVFPQVLEAKQYLAKPSTNQQSWWTSNCKHPPSLQEAEVAIPVASVAMFYVSFCCRWCWKKTRATSGPAKHLAKGMGIKMPV